MKRIILIVCKLLLVIPYYFYQLKKYEKREKYSLEERYCFVRKLVNRIIKAARVDVICTGVEKLPEESGYLIAPNHQGLFDPLVIAGTHEKPLTAVVKIELEKVPVVGSVIKILNAKPMDRSNLRTSMKLMREVTKEMSEGINYIIFPEGTRSKNGNEMLEFKGGTFKSAIDSKKPIVPVALIDCYKVFDSNSIKKVTAQVHYLDPIYPETYEDLSSIEIAALVQNKIKEKMDEVINERN